MSPPATVCDSYEFQVFETAQSIPLLREHAFRAAWDAGHATSPQARPASGCQLLLLAVSSLFVIALVANPAAGSSSIPAYWQGPRSCACTNP